MNTQIQTQTYEYTIGEQFACPIEYGDVTCLSDDEETALRNFCDWASEPYVDGGGNKFEFMGFVFPTDTDEFNLCEITGMRGATITLHAVFKYVGKHTQEEEQV